MSDSITLTAELGRGGEAIIYHIAEQSDLVAKIYYNPTPARETKLRAMLLNPPEQPATHVAIAWPVALLYQRDSRIFSVTTPNSLEIMNRSQFIGFLMPKITDGRSIFHIYNPALREQLPYPFDWRALHRAAYNLCVVISAIHAKGYVIGDINESNILVNRDALVTIVDCDSFQVTDELGKIHRCQVGKPEFTPPELQGVSFKEVDQRPEHDLFGLGVLLFQLLMEGYHPFAGVLKSQASVGRVDLYAIREGLFPYANQPTITPPPSAPDFGWLQPQIQQLFKICFELGRDNPTTRPSGQDWEVMLQVAQQTLTHCQKAGHWYSSHLSTCPHCQQMVSVPKLTKPRPQKKISPKPPLPKPTKPTPPVQIGRSFFTQKKIIAFGGVLLMIIGQIIYWGGVPFSSTFLEPMAPLPQTPPIAFAEMVPIPAGKFFMGSNTSQIDRMVELCQDDWEDCDASWFDAETPQHIVYLDEFYMDPYEVTNAQFQACVEAGSCEKKPVSGCKSIESPYDDATKADYPVICVDWEQAQDYCNWAGKRLPTEAEWEKAARGSEGRIFPWGNEFDSKRLNFADSHPNDDETIYTTAVGSYPSGANPEGIYDLAGNVGEWVQDCYDKDYYNISPEDNPANNYCLGSKRVVRGGSWGNHSYGVRSAGRGNWNDYASSVGIGFRCVSSVIPTTENTSTSVLPTITPTSQPSPTPTPWPTIDKPDLTDMVLIPAGEFGMGSTKAQIEIAFRACRKQSISCEKTRFENEAPRHTVYLDTYYMDMYEVTNAQFRNCVERGTCKVPLDCVWSGEPTYNDTDKRNHPVVCVGWNQARAYCESVGKRLPTEAEWEKAARGDDGRIYPWGNEFEGSWLNSCDKDCASWVNQDSSFRDGYAKTAPVGSFPNNISPYGVYDMAGNVREWVQDCYDEDYYKTGPADNPHNSCNNLERRVVRGGGWSGEQLDARSTKRIGWDGNKSYASLGFRCTYTPTSKDLKPQFETGITRTIALGNLGLPHLANLSATDKTTATFETSLPITNNTEYPIFPGDTITHVQTLYGIEYKPEPISWIDFDIYAWFYNFEEQGVHISFGDDYTVTSVSFNDVYTGTVDGIAIGDSRGMVLSLKGEPDATGYLTFKKDVRYLTFNIDAYSRKFSQRDGTDWLRVDIDEKTDQVIKVVRH